MRKKAIHGRELGQDQAKGPGLDFVLKDQDNEEIHLFDLRGKRVLLSFHPLAWTPVCTDQMKTLSSPWGSAWIASRARWPGPQHLGIKRTRLQADCWPHGGLAVVLGLFRE